jgi:biopolymer transport protein ExbB/TolQ
VNPFARNFYLFVGASVPAAFGLLVTAIEMLQTLNDITARSIADPAQIAAMKAAAFAPAWLGLEVSVPLWLAWGVYLLIVSGKPKE